MLGLICQLRAQRIAWLIRKPRNNADECHCAETRRDGAFRAICIVAPLARGACHGRRVASRISSRKASVAATRDLFRGSLGLDPPRPAAQALPPVRSAEPRLFEITSKTSFAAATSSTAMPTDLNTVVSE